MSSRLGFLNLGLYKFKIEIGWVLAKDSATSAIIETPLLNCIENDMKAKV